MERGNKNMIVYLTVALTIATYALSAWLIYSISADLYRVRAEVEFLQRQVMENRKSAEACRAEFDVLADEFRMFRHLLEDDGK